MQWAQIRAELERACAAAKRRGVTQTMVAERGGLSGQNIVSRTLANDNLGPAAEILTRTIEGLGLSVSEFFSRVERRARGEHIPDEENVIEGSYAKPTTIHPPQDYIVDTIVQALQRSQLVRSSPKRRRKR
jgi:transcriptional regulator with XRE-family HTH domain